METSLEKLQHSNDAVLIRMFQRGSNRALYVLVNRYQDNLKKYAHKLLQNSALEKDAVQNVWLEVINKLQKRAYREKYHFKEWLQSLLHWRAANIQKTEAQYVHKMPGEQTEVNSDLSDKLLFEKRLEQVRKSYSRLNERIRTVVQLRVEQDMSFPEIARAMNTSVNNVTSWYSRAVKRLRKLNHK